MEKFTLNSQFNQIQKDGRTIVLQFGISATKEHKKILTSSAEMFNEFKYLDADLRVKYRDGVLDENMHQHWLVIKKILDFVKAD